MSNIQLFIPAEKVISADFTTRSIKLEISYETNEIEFILLKEITHTDSEINIRLKVNNSYYYYECKVTYSYRLINAIEYPIIFELFGSR